MSYEKQVDKAHYSFEKYFFPGRWMSYWYQTKEITQRKDVLTVLDVGPGTTFLKDILRVHRPDISYTTVDVAEDVLPDVIGSVTKLPFSNESFDVVCAFQVLEHIAFSDFELALAEMKRVSKKYIFISLPHFGPSVEVWFKIPLMKRIKFSFKVPVPKKHVFGGQHYWEIGKRGYSARKIRQILQEQFTIQSEYVPFENQYHHFYILEKK
jgi:ubiquinone/menaquinone biosynthesis C-methylase UbiE